MSRRERDKGRVGEAEVANIYRAHGLTVRGLEGGGDHLLACPADGMPAFHSEVKRQETARVWDWFAQAQAEAPPGAVPLVAFRRNRSPWLGLIALDHLATLIELASIAVDHGHADWMIGGTVDQ